VLLSVLLSLLFSVVSEHSKII